MKMIKTLLLILILSISAFAQDSECLSKHDSPKEFYDSMRILPAKIISIDRENNLLFWRFEDRKAIYLGSFKLIKEGKYEPNFYADNDSLFVFMWCQKHLVVWQIVKVEKKK